MAVKAILPGLSLFSAAPVPIRTHPRAHEVRSTRQKAASTLVQKSDKGSTRPVVNSVGQIGKYGLLKGFYTAEELSELVRTHFAELHQPQRLFVTHDKPQNGIIARNADVVIRGRFVGL